MSNLPSMPKGLRHSWENLTALVDAAHERTPVPCRTDVGVPSLWWTSSHAAEESAAAAACAPCSVRTQCLAYGVEHWRESGALGGLTERQRAKAARQIAKDRNAA